MQTADISKNLGKKLIAIILTLLIIVTPISVYADTYNDYNNPYSYLQKNSLGAYGNPENLGEVIAINVDYYEPQTIKSSQIEAAAVPIYAILKGYTLGSYFGANAPEMEPFISKPKIKDIVVYETTPSQYVSLVKYNYVNRESLDLDNLGSVVIVLRQIKDETKVPEEITLNLTAKIRFDFMRGFGDVSANDLILQEYPNESSWLGARFENSFWHGKGLLRLARIEGNRADIQIYNKDVSPVDLLFDAEENQYGLSDRGIITIGKGETRTFTLPGSSAFFRDQVRITLNDISDPQDTVLLKVISNGEIKYSNVIVDMKIAPASEWEVKEINVAKDKAGNPLLSGNILLRNRIGNTVRLDFSKNQGAGIVDINENNVDNIENTICTESNIIKDDNIDGLNSGNIETAKKLLCTAVAEYKKAISENAVSNDNIYVGISNSYNKLSNYIMDYTNSNLAKSLAIYYLKRISDVAKVENLLYGLEKEIYTESATGLVRLEDENTLVNVVDFKPLQSEQKSSAEIDGISGKVYKNTLLTTLNIQEGTKIISWKVSSIESNYITLKKEIEDNNVKIPTTETFTLQLGKTEIVNGKSIKLNKVNSQKRAYVSIMPGRGDTYSESSFIVHIPIEKREIQWTPEQIDHLIEETEKQIKTLETYITQLESLVKSWKYVCYATFAWITIKNSFLTGSERNRARKEVMPTYDKMCEEEVVSGKYKSHEKCLFEKSGEIEQALDAATTVEENIDKCYKQGKECYSKHDKKINCDGKTDETLYPTIANEQNLGKLGIQIPIDYETFRDYDRCISYDSLESLPTNFKTYNKEKCDELKENICNQRQAYTLATEQIKDTLSDKNFENLIKDKTAKDLAILKYKTAYKSGFDYQTNQPKEAEVIALNEKFSKLIDGKTITKEQISVVSYPNDKTNDYNLIFVNSIDKKVSLTEKTAALPVTLRDTTAGKAKSDEYDKLDCLKKQNDIKCQELSAALSQPQEIQIGNRKAYLFKKSDESRGIEYYAAFDKIQLTTEGTRTDYPAVGNIIETDDKGRGYRVPTGKDGNYFWIYGWTVKGDPEPGKFEEWNIGPDGIIGTGDDLRVSDHNVMEPRLGEVMSASKKIQGRCNKEGNTVEINDIDFTCSQKGYKTDTQTQATSCETVMDPSDCRMLFAVCDPVMCPASRFNFGGKWPIEGSVAQTGIIGSLILGLPNFPQTPLPVCLPGILGGLKRIKGLLDQFVVCLKASKVNHENIGICDKIRSIGICEELWRELINIFKLRGSLVSMITSKMGGEGGGGGEYLKGFNENINEVTDSVNFFTKEYADSAFAAYQGRTTAEFGSQVCKSAIYGKFADIGNFVDQLAEPEDPSQFFATFDEAPWSLTAGKAYNPGMASSIQQSEYSVYYNLYAGNIPEFAKTGYARDGIRYAVYLRNDYGNIIYVTTREVGQTWSTVPYGQTVDMSVERFGPKGMTQICVNMNGKEDCGFGMVTTNFAMNKFSDAIVSNEVQKRIKTEQDCIPDVPTLAPSLQAMGVQPSTAAYGVLPRQYGVLSTGIVRRCSVIDPDGDGKRWVEIGTCGFDKEGRNLGTCWIDSSTASTNDLQLNDELQAFIQQRELVNKVGLEEAMKSLFDEKQSVFYLEELNKKKEEYKKDIKGNTNKLIELLKGYTITRYTTTGDPITLPLSYRTIVENSVDPDSRLLAQISIGEIYYLLADTIAKPAKKETEPEKIEKTGVETVCANNKDCSTGYCEVGICVEKPLIQALTTTITLKKGETKVAGLKDYPGFWIKLDNLYGDNTVGIDTPCGIFDKEQGFYFGLNKPKEVYCEKDNKKVTITLTDISFSKNTATLSVNVNPFLLCEDCGKGATNLCGLEECKSIGKSGKPECYLHFYSTISSWGDCRECPSKTNSKVCEALEKNDCDYCSLCSWDDLRNTCTMRGQKEQIYWFRTVWKEANLIPILQFIYKKKPTDGQIRDFWSMNLKLNEPFKQNTCIKIKLTQTEYINSKIGAPNLALEKQNDCIN